MTILSHTVVLGASDLENPLSPRIGYDNFFREGTVTASSEGVDNPKELAYDGLTYDGWESTGNINEWIAVELSLAEEADYMAIAAHNLAGATLTPQYSFDGVAWSDLAPQFIPASNRPVVWEFDSVVAKFYRLFISTAPDVVKIGAIHVGKSLKLPIAMPKGWEPPSLNEEIEYSNIMSHGGQILGRTVIRKEARADVITEPVEFMWARSEFQAFMDVADRYAVFFWWTFQELVEIIYGGVEDRSVKFWSTELLSTRFKLVGINR